MNRRKECMYWDVDHCEPVYCEEKFQGALVTAYDSGIQQLLRKINRPDTLTVQNALGKVWYDKSDNQSARLFYKLWYSSAKS